MGISTLLSIPAEGGLEEAKTTEDVGRLREILFGDMEKGWRISPPEEEEEEEGEDKGKEKEKGKEEEEEKWVDQVDLEKEKEMVGKEVVSIDLDRTGFVMHYLLSGDVNGAGAMMKAKVPLSCKVKRSDKYYVVKATESGVTTDYGSPCWNYKPDGGTYFSPPAKKKRKIDTDAGSDDENEDNYPETPYSSVFSPSAAQAFTEAEKLIVSKMKQKPAYRIDLNLGEKEKKHPNVMGMKKKELIEELEKRGVEDDGSGVDLLKARYALMYTLNPEGLHLPPYNPDLRCIFGGGKNETKAEMGYGPARITSEEKALKFAQALEEIDEEEFISRFHPKMLESMGFMAWNFRHDESDLNYLRLHFQSLKKFAGVVQRGKVGFLSCLF